MASRSPWPGNVVNGEVADDTDFNTIPGGWLAWDDSSSTQSGITTEVAVSGLTESFTIPSNRAVRYTCKLRAVTDVDQDNITVRIKRGGSTVAAMGFELDTAGTDLYVEGHEFGPSAGSHTVTVTVERSAGSGDVELGVSTGNHWVLVEDMGPSS